ncbi:NAD-dependent epimerase/dehydratase family protein [Mesobacterium pallidum]|uniref:NAD-dependent epimerase/dehydratase family protein n=1 Tax=Mesobacterium pallidum TaxID=2872037 RepID=UPI001EE22FC7|nr:NAD-dependent epimerase/dehydratase family protein [Mesobacterium pallidum]
MTRPVFVTGASGFIARHILLSLLRAGHAVRGSVRSVAKAEDVRASLARHLGRDPEGLAFCLLDLTRDAGWSEAMAGCGALVHTASPVPLEQPDTPETLVLPAVDGTTRALDAAARAGIARVVLTSSVAAISGQKAGAVARFTTTDWTDPNLPGLSPYALSKTLAERAAWQRAEALGLKLTTINPSFVFGPALDADTGASLGVIQRLLTARDPAVPRVSFFVVDVRDVADLHLAALTDDTTAGQRIIAASQQIWLREIAAELRAAHPGHPVPRLPAPDWLVRLLARREPALRWITPSLGRVVTFDTAPCRALLGREMIPARQAVRDGAASLIAHGLA